MHVSRNEPAPVRLARAAAGLVRGLPVGGRAVLASRYQRANLRRHPLAPVIAASGLVVARSVVVFEGLEVASIAPGKLGCLELFGGYLRAEGRALRRGRGGEREEDRGGEEERGDGGNEDASHGVVRVVRVLK